MADMDNTNEETSTSSRRSLLAKAAAAGAVVYAVPMVSSIPAYATGGGTIGSNGCESDTICVWFSPPSKDHHDSEHPDSDHKYGKWDCNEGSGGSGIEHHSYGSDSGSGPRGLTCDVKVNGVTRHVKFAGSPVNTGSTYGDWGKGGSHDSQHYYHSGGGCKIDIDDDNCEIVLQTVVCVKPSDVIADCPTKSDNDPPESWGNGCSDSPINSGSNKPASASAPTSGHFQHAYYHSGRCGGDGGSNDNSEGDNACKWVMIFKVNCNCS